MNPAAKLRELFSKKDLTVIAGAHNGLSAKLVEQAGFDGVWASGLEISASYGVPDASFISTKRIISI
jgi:phosphoenolpyruvate phosphomutase